MSSAGRQFDVEAPGVDEEIPTDAETAAWRNREPSERRTQAIRRRRGRAAVSHPPGVQGIAVESSSDEALPAARLRPSFRDIARLDLVVGIDERDRRPFRHSHSDVARVRLTRRPVLRQSHADEAAPRRTSLRLPLCRPPIRCRQRSPPMLRSRSAAAKVLSIAGRTSAAFRPR